MLQAAYTYDVNGNRASLTYANGVTTTYTYNAANWVTSLQNTRNGETISGFTYTYYANGSQKSKTDSNGAVTAYAVIRYPGSASRTPICVLKGDSIMAEKMTSKELTKLLEGILCPHGFIKKGSAFFRLHGDGVLQTLKWIYEAHMGAHILYFGLLSMYGKILPQWLTSAGCIPTCDAMLLVDQNYYDIKLGFGDWEVSFLHGKVYTAGTTDRNVKNSSEFETLFQIAKTEMFHRMDPEVQLLTFKEIVLPTLNQIDTQSKMYDMICRYSAAPNNPHKIAPLLACGRFNDALAVVRAILAQNRDVFYSKGMTEAECMLDPSYSKNVVLEKMIQEGDIAIRDYLQTNYTENASLFADIFLHSRHYQV